MSQRRTLLMIIAPRSQLALFRLHLFSETDAT